MYIYMYICVYIYDGFYAYTCRRFSKSDPKAIPQKKNTNSLGVPMIFTDVKKQSMFSIYQNNIDCFLIGLLKIYF